MIKDLEKLASDARYTFDGLTNEQINWKPNAESWSIGQCFNHLVVTNKLEIATIEKALQGEHTKTIWEKLPLSPKFTGNFVLKMVDPKNVKKHKAPKAFCPVQSDIDAEIIDIYLKTSEKVIELMKASEGLNIEKMIITSPVSRLATYSLADSFKMFVLHDQRHFNQAKKLLETQGFPK